jgi:hypothetical protein
MSFLSITQPRLRSRWLADGDLVGIRTIADHNGRTWTEYGQGEWEWLQRIGKAEGSIGCAIRFAGIRVLGIDRLPIRLANAEECRIYKWMLLYLNLHICYWSTYSRLTIAVAGGSRAVGSTHGRTAVSQLLATMPCRQSLYSFRVVISPLSSVPPAKQPYAPAL